jgi:hypothetical protein
MQCGQEREPPNGLIEPGRRGETVMAGVMADDEQQSDEEAAQKGKYETQWNWCSKRQEDQAHVKRGEGKETSGWQYDPAPREAQPLRLSQFGSWGWAQTRCVPHA